MSADRGRADDECRFAVRLVDIDYVLVKPDCELDNTRSPLTNQQLSRVPVIRIFGATPRGQKVCVHIHRVYRYFLFPHDGDPPADVHEERLWLRALAGDINGELASSHSAASGVAAKVGEPVAKTGGGAAQVVNMEVVWLTPFYGYHEEKRPFVKVWIDQPSAVDEAARLVKRGFRGRAPLQPFEAHVPFLLQFKVDYNLVGMNFTRLSTLFFRGTLPVTTASHGLPLVQPPPPPSNQASGGASQSSSQGSARGSAQRSAQRSAQGSAQGSAQLSAQRSSPESRTNQCGSHGCSEESSGGRSCCGSGANSSSDARLLHSGYRCVWHLGAVHGLTTSSPLERVATTELEGDAMEHMILNQFDVREEPLSTARRDVRLVQSLEVLWQDEAQRRRCAGNDEPLAAGSTPASEVERRAALPPPPPRVLTDLEEIDELRRRCEPGSRAEEVPHAPRCQPPLWANAAEVGTDELTDGDKQCNPERRELDHGWTASASSSQGSSCTSSRALSQLIAITELETAGSAGAAGAAGAAAKNKVTSAETLVLASESHLSQNGGSAHSQNFTQEHASVGWSQDSVGMLLQDLANVDSQVYRSGGSSQHCSSHAAGKSSQVAAASHLVDPSQRPTDGEQGEEAVEVAGTGCGMSQEDVDLLDELQEVSGGVVFELYLPNLPEKVQNQGSSEAARHLELALQQAPGISYSTTCAVGLRVATVFHRAKLNTWQVPGVVSVSASEASGSVVIEASHVFARMEERLKRVAESKGLPVTTAQSLEEEVVSSQAILVELRGRGGDEREDGQRASDGDEKLALATVEGSGRTENGVVEEKGFRGEEHRQQGGSEDLKAVRDGTVADVMELDDEIEEWDDVCVMTQQGLPASPASQRHHLLHVHATSASARDHTANRADGAEIPSVAADMEVEGGEASPTSRMRALPSLAHSAHSPLARSLELPLPPIQTDKDREVRRIPQFDGDGGDDREDYEPMVRISTGLEVDVAMSVPADSTPSVERFSGILQAHPETPLRALASPHGDSPASLPREGMSGMEMASIILARAQLRALSSTDSSPAQAAVLPLTSAPAQLSVLEVSSEGGQAAEHAAGYASEPVLGSLSEPGPDSPRPVTTSLVHSPIYLHSEPESESRSGSPISMPMHADDQVQSDAACLVSEIGSQAAASEEYVGFVNSENISNGADGAGGAGEGAALAAVSTHGADDGATNTRFCVYGPAAVLASCASKPVLQPGELARRFEQRDIEREQQLRRAEKRKRRVAFAVAPPHASEDERSVPKVELGDHMYVRDDAPDGSFTPGPSRGAALQRLATGQATHALTAAGSFQRQHESTQRPSTPLSPQAASGVCGGTCSDACRPGAWEGERDTGVAPAVLDGQAPPAHPTNLVLPSSDAAFREAASRQSASAFTPLIERPESPKYDGVQERRVLPLFDENIFDEALCESDSGETSDRDEDVRGGATQRGTALRATSQCSASASAIRRMASQRPATSYLAAGLRVLTPRRSPPSPTHVTETVQPRVIFAVPHFSDRRDIPAKGSVMNNKLFRFGGGEQDVLSLCSFSCVSVEETCSCRHFPLAPAPFWQRRVLTPALLPPPAAAVRAWHEEKRHRAAEAYRTRRSTSATSGAGGDIDSNTGRMRCALLAVSASGSEHGSCMASAGSAAGGSSPCGDMENRTGDGVSGPTQIQEQQSSLGSNDSHGSSVRRSRSSLPPVTQISMPPSSPRPAAEESSTELHSCQNLTLLALEVHVRTKGDKVPNPGRAGNDEVRADPGDEILAVAYALEHDHIGRSAISAGASSALKTTGVIVRSDPCSGLGGEPAEAARSARRLVALLGGNVEMETVGGEEELLIAVARLVRRHDADVLMSWDSKRLSFGYLLDRADTLQITPPLIRQLGRTPDVKHHNESRGKDEWGERVASGYSIVGRLVLNLWRCARESLTLSSYTLENVAAHLLSVRAPHYAHRTLARWWDQGVGSTGRAGVQQQARGGAQDGGRVHVLRYYLRRVSLSLSIAEGLELISRTSELARVMGIDFFSVLTRGSQYRVESILLRLARTQCFAIPSPDKQQVAGQPALQALALTMEPDSQFYTSPVIVLDFRSLYPSVIIAYNYCYSTCLGPTRTLLRMLKPEEARLPHRFGCLELSARGFCTSQEASAVKGAAALLHKALDRISDGHRLSDGWRVVAADKTTHMSSRASGDDSDVADGRAGAAAAAAGASAGAGPGNGDSSSRDTCGLHASPNGILFVNKTRRPGLLPRMLSEILETRFMVKRAMKSVPKTSPLYRTLNARQFGLKLIANVTYGYTSASFSGRMPNSHLADAIVQTGRETLERAARMVDAHPRWGAKVVYGDTDSLFVHVPGRSRTEAFELGREMAQVVTAANPYPMELELEKVYHPCVLLTKKRYAGYMYEHEGAAEPIFDAKGIETVRRDGCPAERKILEKCLRLLFTSADLSLVRAFVMRQFDKVSTGRLPLQDFMFSSEVRLGTYARDSVAPPGAQVAMARQKSDARDVAELGERIPYVVVYPPTSPNYKLLQSARRPEELLWGDSGLEVNAEYYILKRIIPALDRVLALVGVTVASWYSKCKRRRRAPLDRPLPNPSKQVTLPDYLLNCHCVLCDDEAKGILCRACSAQRPQAVFVMQARQRLLEVRVDRIVRHCMNCSFSHERAVECASLDCPHLFTRFKLQRQLRSATEHLRLLSDW